MARPETPSVTEKRALPELSTNCISTMRKLVARFPISDSFSGLSQALGTLILYSRAMSPHIQRPMAALGLSVPAFISEDFRRKILISVEFARLIPCLNLCS